MEKQLPSGNRNVMSTNIVRFSHDKPAHLLAAYLKAKSIDASVVEQSIEGEPQVAFCVQIANPEQKRQAISIAEEFVKNPNHPQYQQAAWDIGEGAPSKSLMEYVKLPTLKNLRETWLTSIVGITCIVIFILMYLGYSTPIYNALKIQYLDELAQNHQWWRLFGPDFMHGGVLHLLSNLLWWFLLASKLERVFGHVWLFTLFVVSSLAANIMQLLYSGPNFLGLSGVVYALFGFMWWIGFLRPHWRLNLPNGLIGMMLIWLVLGYADVLGTPIANQAHMFGLISGCILALLTHQLVALFSKKAE